MHWEQQLELIANNVSEHVQSVPRSDSSWTISFKYSSYLAGLSGSSSLQSYMPFQALTLLRYFSRGEICLQTDVEATLKAEIHEKPGASAGIRSAELRNERHTRTLDRVLS